MASAFSPGIYGADFHGLVDKGETLGRLPLGFRWSTARPSSYGGILLFRGALLVDYSLWPEKRHFPQAYAMGLVGRGLDRRNAAPAALGALPSHSSERRKNQ